MTTITNDNYFRVIETIGDKLPEAFRDLYNQFNEIVKESGWGLVDEALKADKEKHFADLAAWMAKEEIHFSDSPDEGESKPKREYKKKKKEDSAPEEKSEDSLSKLRDEAERIMPVHQRKVVRDFATSDQKATYSLITKMMEDIPKLYAQDGKGKKAIVHLHYFHGGSDWFITEYEPKEDLFFGFTVLNGDIEMAEFGSISITEMLNTPPIELDFYWKKITVAQALINAGYGDFVNESDAKQEESEEEIPEDKTPKAETVTTTKPKREPNAKVKKSRRPRIRRVTVKRKVKKSDPPRPATKPKNVELVSHPSIEIQLIRRFIKLDGKPKTRNQIRAFIGTLQRAIVNRQIRKVSPHSKEIVFIQDKLIEMHGKLKDDNPVAFDLAGKKFDQLRIIAGMQVTRPSVLLIRRYVAMHGRHVEKCNALKLLSSIEREVGKGKITAKDPYFPELKVIVKSLREFSASGNGILKIHSQALSGLQAVLAGCGCSVGNQSRKSYSLSGLVSSTQNPDTGTENVIRTDMIPDMSHKTIGLQGKWRTLFGNVPYGFSAMIYGKPKEGKSTLLVDFAGYLAENHGKVLWVELEEDIPTELNPKIQRLNAAHPDFLVIDHLPGNISDYDFVVLNSISEGKIHIDQLRALKRDNPNTSFLFVYHTRKDGKFQGGQEHAHLVSVMVEVAKGYATGKGRFGGGRIPINFGLTG